MGSHSDGMSRYPSVLVHNPRPLLYPVWIPLLNGPLQFASVSEENAHGFSVCGRERERERVAALLKNDL